ncbi:acyl-ACP--UDP-N-acetylglucosamine O-acyltransferase [Ponticaulis sp.]|uniref:acyl-ACP--UDP-N-acetylglucosamine O-acyltransferase n=1 Tax=Ponticaulis sp. TaxID=2020902 RepID=UPI002630F388|nr:acyl-ACP--UDP-N-acetylglucosamine O-acyltransferase [Ponticaulis sp.]MDF1681524.1 acyl-ACP--UDP-N-acetylglucosamine O-acyltransferase [Ponticaulis sp.]
MADIHQTAIIADGAQIHESARIGPYCTVGPHAIIHEDVFLHSFVVVDGNSEIHAGCELYPSVTVGMKPQILGVKDDVYSCIIGAGCVLRENVTVHGATPGSGEATRLGENCFLMVNSHIGHDAKLGNKCVLAPNSMVGGHAHLGDQVWMGGGAAIHQNSWVGDHAFIAAGCMLTGDVIPYAVAEGTDSRLATLNATGLTRRGFSRGDLKAIRQVYHHLFLGDEGTFKERLANVREKFAGEEAALKIVDFVEHPRSGRKLCTA